MRAAFRSQLPLLATYGSHPRARELVALDRLIEHNPELVELVSKGLLSRPTVSKDNGRPGMSGEQILRCAIVRVLENCSYEDLEFLLTDSRSYGRFCRIGIAEKSPSASALQENLRGVEPEVWKSINDAVVRLAKELGVEGGAKVRVDCTVTAANIHPPDDAAQLFDVVRVLQRLLRQAEKLRAGVKVHSRTKRAKRRRLEILNEKGEERKAAYRDLMRVTEEVLGWAKSAVGLLRADAPPNDPASHLANEIEHFVKLGEQVVEQTRRRVIAGEKVPAQQKVVSIFEPHTDIIIKDKRDVHYGHKLLIATGASGLVLHCEVLKGNPADSTLVGPALDSVASALGSMPEQAAFDGCFASQEGLALAKDKGVRDVCFSKRRGMEIADMARSNLIYRALWRFRAGVEAGISWLKRCFGLDRCNWKGEDGFHAYVQSSVVAFNLVVLARALTPG